MAFLRRFRQTQLNESEEIISLSAQPSAKNDLADTGQANSLTSFNNDFRREPEPIAENVHADLVNDPDAAAGQQRFTGWKVGAASAAALGCVALIINVAALVWLQRHPNGDSGLVEVYHGNCHRVEQMQIWSHLAINALSTLLLSGSNYSMQVLCAPTRTELDKAHGKRKYLDIGVQSIQNLWSISPKRAAVWWILGLSSIPLHLMYNSAFYSSIGVSDYRTSFVNQGFIEGQPFALGSHISTDRCPGNSTCESHVEEQLRSVQSGTADLERLDPRDCLVAYANVLLTDRSNLVLVTSDNNETLANNSLLLTGTWSFSEALDLQQARYRPYEWICHSSNRMHAAFPEYRIPEQNPCDSWLSVLVANSSAWTPWDYNISHCLSQTIAERCSFNGNTSILTVVIVFNVLKILAMLWTAFCLPLDNLPLITLGDAIASYLHRPDPTTLNYGLWSRNHFKTALTDISMTWPPTGFVSKPSLPTTKTPNLKPHRYRHGATTARWTWTLLFLVAALITVLSLLGAGYSAINAHNTPLSALGFGKINASALVNGWGIVFMTDTSKQIAAAVIVANLPQTILSFLYLHLNGLVTSMCGTGELLSYASRGGGEGKALRVSLPRRGTRQWGTWFLQLPYAVAVPLMVGSGVLHWLVSQSFFLAVVAEYDWEGNLVDATAVATCGFSLVPMMVVLGLGMGILVGLIGTGWLGRWTGKEGMPLVGSCSLGISALCHPPEGDEWAEYKEVRWGVVREEGIDGEPARCSFASGPVGEVVEGRQYA